MTKDQGGAKDPDVYDKPHHPIASSLRYSHQLKYFGHRSVNHPTGSDKDCNLPK